MSARSGRRPPGTRRTGRAGISMPRTGGMPTAWRASRRPGTSLDVLGCAIALADIRIAQGRLREAMSTYERGLQLATRAGRAGAAGRGGHARGHERAPPRTQRSRCRQAAPADEQRTGRACRPAAEPVSLARGDGADPAGRRRSARGALDLLDEAERLYVSDFSPDVRPIPALRARVRVAAGRAGRSARLGARAGLSVGGRPQLPARVRAHHPRPGAPGPVRERSGPRPVPPTRRPDSGAPPAQRRKRGRRTGSVIEILVAAGARPPSARATSPLRWLRCSGADAGRAGGLRPALRR